MSRMTTDMTDMEVAEALRKHRRTIQRWAQKGLLPGAYKAGRAWRIPRSALHRANLRPHNYRDFLVSR
ncbi:MAG: helix-turn-helix domain-containing protein [Gammaproteobacteria bacterium]